MAEMETRTENPQHGESEERKKRRRLKKLQHEIREQIEFYFGDSNLRKDRFLKQEIDKTEEGYIHISTIATFNQIRKLTTDEALIARALQKSELLEVSQDKTQIRRHTPLQEPKYNIDDVTVYVEHLPHNVDHDMLKKAFSPCGTIGYISLPRYRTTGDPKRFAFIEFTTPEDAAKACKLLNNPPKSNLHPDGHFPTTRKGRLILPEHYTKPKPIPASRHSDKHAQENFGKRKRDDSENGEASSDLAKDETPRKKKAMAKSESDDKVVSKSKGDSENVVEHSDDKSHLNTSKKVKKRKETHQDGKTKKEHHSENVDEDKKDANVHSRHKDKKSSRKRKHSGEDTVQEKRTHSDKNHESKSHNDEKLSTGAKEEKSKKDSDSLETHKRKRDDPGQSIAGSKVKESSGHEDRDEVTEAKKRRMDSNIEGDKRKKRSRSRRNKKDEGPPVPMMQLTVIPKTEWLALKKEYLAIQKASRQQLKQTLRETHTKHTPTQGQNNQHQQGVQPQVSEGKLKSSEPEFVPGVVLKISSEKEFTSRKELRDKLEEICPVAYIDLKDGDNSGFVRLKSPEGATAVLGKASRLTLENGQVDLKMLSGDEEQQYWDKLRADRVSKLNCKKRKPRKRGVNRIMDRSEKVLGNKKTFFDDEED